MQSGCPEVLTLTLPADPAEIPEFLRHVWAFDHLRVTEEDRHRTELYAQQVERGRAEKQAGSLSEFLASLQLEVRIAPMTPEQLPRVAQLTERTNQMNFTTVRRSESEIHELLDSGGAECLTVDVSDRFGSYGLTGVMIFAHTPEALAVDTFLLSCRALGRGVEHRMLARLGEIARERGLARWKRASCARSATSPALLFLESAGRTVRAAWTATSCASAFRPEHAAAVEYHPNGRPRQAERRSTSAPAATARRESITRASPANCAIAAADPRTRARAGCAARPRSAGAAVAPRTELESGGWRRSGPDTLGLP